MPKMEPVHEEGSLGSALPACYESASVSVGKPSASRIRHLVFPREHGAWGMLLIPMLTGGILGFRSGHDFWSLALLVVAGFSLFCLRTPFEALIAVSPYRARNSAERRSAILAVSGYLAVALIAMATLMTRVSPGPLLILGNAAAIGFGGQLILRRFRPTDRCLAQLVGSAGLTATAAAAYFVAAGQWSAIALLVWAANWLFAANQIHYVQLRIHAANCAGRLEKLHKGLHFAFGEVVLMAVLVAAGTVGALPWVACLAYVPLLVRGIAWFAEKPAPLAIRRLGFTELAHAITFGVLLVLVF